MAAIFPLRIADCRLTTDKGQRTKKEEQTQTNPNGIMLFVSIRYDLLEKSKPNWVIWLVYHEVAAK